VQFEHLISLAEVKMKEITLDVKGMSCQMCVKHVTDALRDINGVETVEVSLDDAAARLQYDPEHAGMEDFKAAVAEAGYEVVT
jgi:copper ion binding protein